MKDVLEAEQVEILIDDQHKIWININGVCEVRVGLAKSIVLDDRRGEKLKPQPIEYKSTDELDDAFNEIIDAFKYFEEITPEKLLALHKALNNAAVYVKKKV